MKVLFAEKCVYGHLTTTTQSL